MLLAVVHLAFIISTANRAPAPRLLSNVGHDLYPLSPSSQGDGRYLISNGKDQTLKLWDVRRFGNQEGMDQVRKAVNKSNWDYRWEAVPKRNMKKAKLNGDVSVMTYRGHGVLCTLIR